MNNLNFNLKFLTHALILYISVPAHLVCHATSDSFGLQLCKHLSISLSESTAVSQNSCSQNGARHPDATSPLLDPVYIHF